MSLSAKAETFAMKAHEGMSRKDEKDKPFVIHPMITGEILKNAGFNDAVVAAGYLHDVPEDTEYTVDDIARMFGGTVASLVMTAVESDSTLSWKERKKERIKQCKYLPEKNKAVILADKIANLEDIKIYSMKNGYLNFDNYGASAEEQCWYYENMLKSLEHNVEDPRLEILLDRLYDNIIKVFYSSLTETKKPTNRINSENAQVKELKTLKTLLKSPKPFIIEFQSDNKTTPQKDLLDISLDFFYKKNFKIKVGETNNILSKENVLSLSDRDALVYAEMELGFLSKISENQDIVILDNALFDKLILIQRLLQRKDITNEDFEMYINYFKESVNYVSINCPDNKDEITVNKIFNQINLLKTYKLKIEETNLTEDNSYKIFDSLLPIMRKEYIKELKLHLNNKTR